MINIGRILKSRIGKNRDATQTSQILQVQMTEAEDVQESDEMRIPGVQYNPPVNSMAFIARVSAAFKFIVGINDNIPKLETLLPGERKAYGSKDEAMVCSLWYKNDGTMQIDTNKDLVANVTGNIDFTAATMNVIGDVNITGAVTVDGALQATGDIVADSATTAISLLQHPHLGNLGFNTAPPLTVGGGSPAPTSPPTSNATGGLITGSGGIDVDLHVHPYTWTAGGGAGNTSVPM